MTKKALICGISGQDGTYLAKLLLEKGYIVYGTSRDAQLASFSGLHKLGIRDKVYVESMSITDFRSVLQVVEKTKPNEVYNFAGQSSVGLSFDQPVETMESHAIGSLNLLETIRFLGGGIKFYNAGSGECFGDTEGCPAAETSPFRPKSPYAVAKAAAFWEVVNYREAYGLHACSGILFNHESPLRPDRFVTKKIIKNACEIYRGAKKPLLLGNVDIRRDWGWAPEYVEAMWRMLQRDVPEDFVIATGESHSLLEFVQEAFAILGLDYEDHVEISKELYRPTDIKEGFGNSSKAKEKLKWSANVKMKDVVREMIKSELNSCVWGGGGPSD